MSKTLLISMRNKINKLLSRTGDVALRRRANWVLQQVLKFNPSLMLDAGCGDGFYLHLISSLLPKVRLIGLDADPKALKSARRNIKKQIRLIKGSLEKLKFKDSIFDLVLVSEVLEHLDNDLIGLKEAYKVLKPGGLILITVPNINYPLMWDPVNWVLERVFNFHFESGFWAGIWNQHKRLYNPIKLKFLLKKAGFGNIDIQSLTLVCLPFNHYLLNIFARILVLRSQTFQTSSLNKFSYNQENKFQINPFWLVFAFDKLNDIFKSKKMGVSLVASAVKASEL